MRFKTWMGSAVLVPAVFACAAQQQTADGEPTRPGGIEIGFADKEGLGVVPAGAEDGVWPSASQQADEFMTSRGLNLSWNNRGTPAAFLLVRGEAPILSDSKATYGSARRIAFDKARFSAMQEVAKQAGSVASAQILIGQGIAEVDQQQIESFFRERFGGRPADQISIDPDKKILLESYVSEAAGRTDQLVVGMQIFKVFEGPRDVCILASWSPNTRKIIEAILKPQDPVKGKAGNVSIADWATAIGDELLYTHGTQVRTDENGELSLVAFGQREMEGAHPAFRSQARASAIQDAELELRRFLTTVYASQFSGGTTSASVVQGSEDETAIRERWSQDISAAIRVLDLPMPPVVHEASFLHPRSSEAGTDTVCVVLYTNVSMLKEQDALRDWMRRNQVTETAGRPQVSAPESTRQESSSPTKPKPRSSGGQGATGEAP